MSMKKLSNSSPEFLTVTVTGYERNRVMPKVVDYFCDQHRGSPSQILEAVLLWNENQCKPPFERNELEAVLQYRFQVKTAEDLASAKQKSSSRSGKILDVVLKDDQVTLLKDQNAEAYGRIKMGQKEINVPVFSRDFSNFVKHKVYTETRELVTDLNIKDAVGFIAAEANYNSPQHDLFHRVAEVKGSFYYYLQDGPGDMVRINQKGWEIVSGSTMPFLFKEGCGRRQVRPKHGGDLKDFLKLINIKDSDDQMLFLCTLPVRLIRNIDQAIVCIYGPAGSAKTSLLKMTKELLDPSIAGVSMPVRNVEDVAVLLNQSWVFANDNISKINDELSNFFCVMATGAESARRKLYTDSEISVLTVKNPAYITGVNIEAYRSDLLSRVLLFKTDLVPLGERKSATQLQWEFEEMRPYLLGAMFDILSRAITVKEKLSQKTEFRMADFALWGAACAEVMGYGAAEFEEALQRSMKSRAYDAIYSTTAGRSLLHYLEERQQFEGTVADLLQALKESNENERSGYYESVAANPAALGKKLRELENSLAAVGFILDFGKRTSAERRISIRKTQN